MNRTIDTSQYAIADNESGDGYDSDSTSLAGSAISNESEDELSSVHHLAEMLANAFDASSLDRVVVIQAQTSGIINAKVREVQVMTDEARIRLAEVKQLFQEGIKTAKLVQRDLEYTQRKLKTLAPLIKEMYPIEYVKAEEQITGVDGSGSRF